MNFNLKIFLLFIGSVLAFTVKAQECKIQVKSEIVHATSKSLGSVSFTIDSQTGSDDYSIFRVGTDQPSKIVSAYHFQDLAVGIVEFVIIDKKKKDCAKEVQVKIEKH